MQIAIKPSSFTHLSDDTSPQLGGDLDLNGHEVVTTSNGNVGLVADGTGGLYLLTPSTTALGDCSVDLSRGRSAASQIASGDYAYNLGRDCTASGDYAHALGYGAVASMFGQQAFANGYAVAAGDRQRSAFLMTRDVTHTTADWFDLYLNGTTGSIVMPSGSFAMVEASVLALKTDGSSARWKIIGSTDGVMDTREILTITGATSTPSCNGTYIVYEDSYNGRKSYVSRDLATTFYCAYNGTLYVVSTTRGGFVNPWWYKTGGASAAGSYLASPPAAGALTATLGTEPQPTAIDQDKLNEEKTELANADVQLTLIDNNTLSVQVKNAADSSLIRWFADVSVLWMPLPSA